MVTIKQKKNTVLKKVVQPLPILNPARSDVLKSTFYVTVPQEKNIEYKFYGSFSYDKDAEDCMGTGTLRMPYDPTLWSFWEPGFQQLTIKGGTYDESIIFHGRTRGVKQDGQNIEIALQDDGWHLKQEVTGTKPTGSVQEKFVTLVKQAGMTPIVAGLREDYQIVTDQTTTGQITGSATGGQAGEYVLQDTSTGESNQTIDSSTDTSNSEATTSKDTKTTEQQQEEDNKTYEDWLKDITTGHDLIFYTNYNNECILYDYPSLMSEMEKYCFQVEDWMIKYPSFSLDVNQFGYYNTVKVKYGKGTVKESYEDLVKVFGEVIKTVNSSTTSKTKAISIAKETLAGLLRDFGMEITVEVLHSGAIVPGTFIKAPNPMTKNIETYFVSGINVSMEPNSAMMNSLTLLYAPKNPEVESIPEIAGAKGTTDASGDSNFVSIMQAGAKYHYAHNCADMKCMMSTGSGDCYAMSDFLYTKLKAAGIKVRIVMYATSVCTSYNCHRSVEYFTNGKWVDVPYAKYGYDTNFRTEPHPNANVYKQ